MINTLIIVIIFVVSIFVMSFLLLKKLSIGFIRVMERKGPFSKKFALMRGVFPFTMTYNFRCGGFFFFDPNDDDNWAHYDEALNQFHLEKMKKKSKIVKIKS